jgi:protocatechuate 3,4-dioxygenase beta subunit
MNFRETSHFLHKDPSLRKRKNIHLVEDKDLVPSLLHKKNPVKMKINPRVFFDIDIDGNRSKLLNQVTNL